MMKFVLGVFIFINVSSFCYTKNISTIGYHSRIVNGVRSHITEFPFFVHIVKSDTDRLLCGGSIITRNAVLSAGHCFAPYVEYIAKQIYIRALSSYSKKGGVKYNVESIVVHPNYDDFLLDWDVSIIKVKGLFDESLPIRLTDITTINEIVGRFAVVCGAGRRNENGTSVNHLRKVRLPIIPEQVCDNYYEHTITPRMMCAGYEFGVFDACIGDSGGPMILDGKLIGIVSWGNGCARARFPGVYTFIPTVKTWIYDNI